MKRPVQGALAVGVLSSAIAALFFAGPTSARVEGPEASAKEFRNCTALNRMYPHGVGRVGARDRDSKGKPLADPVTNFKRSNLLYRQNKKSDRDGDFIACEKK